MQPADGVAVGDRSGLREGIRRQAPAFDYPQGTYRGCTGPVYIPAELTGIVTAVLGLRPPAGEAEVPGSGEPGELRRGPAGGVSFSPDQVAKLYDFPGGANGAGQCIGIIELGGGSVQAI